MGPNDAAFSSDQVSQSLAYIEEHVYRTPIHTSLASSTISKLACRPVDGEPLEVELLFKCENLQKTNSFKIRGVTYALMRMSDAMLRQGIVCFSTGNHALACSAAARDLSQKKGFHIPVYAVMPRWASTTKINAARSYGGIVILEGDSTVEAQQAAAKIAHVRGATLLAPADHPDIVRGQGTATLELICQALEQDGNPLDAVVVPSSGAALLAGSAVVCKDFSIPVFATEPERGSADLKRGRAEQKRPEQIDTSVQTVADGLRSCVAPCAWPIVKDPEYVREVFGVDDDQIKAATKLFVDETKMLIEPCSAVPLAALLFNNSFRRYLVSQKRSWRIGVVITGGNTSVDTIVSMYSTPSLTVASKPMDADLAQTLVVM